MRHQIYSTLQEPNFLQLLHHICNLPCKIKEILFQQVHRFKLLLRILAKCITVILGPQRPCPISTHDFIRNVNLSNIVANC